MQAHSSGESQHVDSQLVRQRGLIADFACFAVRIVIVRRMESTHRPSMTNRAYDSSAKSADARRPRITFCASRNRSHVLLTTAMALPQTTARALALRLRLRAIALNWLGLARTPHPDPPPQGGRERSRSVQPPDGRSAPLADAVVDLVVLLLDLAIERRRPRRLRNAWPRHGFAGRRRVVLIQKLPRRRLAQFRRHKLVVLPVSAQRQQSPQAGRRR